MTKLKKHTNKNDGNIHKGKFLAKKHNFSNRAKRKRCYDVMSLWRMKQELGHLASGLKCTGPAGGETQDVFFWRLAGPAGTGQ